MKLWSVIVSGAFLALGANTPAWAQKSTADRLDVATAPCLAANRDRTNAPQYDIAVCESALEQVEEIYAGIATPTPHDANLRHMYLGFAHTAIGGAYGQLDEFRSPRVCSKAEASWTEILQIIPANSPDSFAASYKAIRDVAITPVTKCRASKGTSVGEAPLPSG